MSTQTSQPLFIPSLHHNIETLLFLTSFYKNPLLQSKITIVSHFSAPFCTFPYLSVLESHLGLPPARFRARFLVRFRTYLSLSHILASLLHVSVPVFLYVSVLICPWVTSWPPSCTFPCPFSCTFPYPPNFCWPCLHVSVPLSVQISFWPVKWIERHGLSCQLNLTFDSIRLRIHAPCLICALKKQTMIITTRCIFPFFSALPPFFLCCFVMFLSCFVSSVPPSVPRDRLSTPAAEKLPP